MRKNTHASGRAPGGRRKLPLVLLAVAAVVAVALGVLSVVDIAGPTIVNLVRKTIKEETGTNLTVENVKGNPIRGYTLDGITLSSNAGQKLFSAAYLTGRVNFASLFRGNPRLSLLAVGGMDMDLDRFIEELSKLKMPEKKGTGEVPIDRISLRDSRFTSRWGEVSIKDVAAQLNGPQTDVDVDGSVNGLPVTGALALNIQGKTLGVNKMDMNIGKGTLSAAGFLRPVSESDRTTELDFQGALKKIDLKEITALWPAFLSADEYDGTTGADFTVKGTGSSPVITADVDYEGKSVGGYPLDRLSARARYAENRLTLDDIDAAALGVPVAGAVILATRPGETPSVMVKLTGQNASLAELSKRFPNLGGVQGELRTFAANIQGPTNALSGTIDLAAPKLAAQGKTLSDVALQVKLTKSDTANVNGKFTFEGAQGFLQGTVASILSGAKLDLTTKLVNLDVKRIADLIPDSQKYGLAGVLNAALAIKGKATAPAVSGTLESPEIKAQGYSILKPSLSFAYAKDVLTLQKSSGTLNGMPAQVTGTIGPLTAKAPPIALTAQLTLKPETLKAFAPELATYQLKGEIRAGVKVTGKLPHPEVSLVATSPALSAMGQVSAKNLEVTTALGGDLSKLDKLDVSIRAESVSAAGMGLQALTGSIKKNGNKLDLPSLSARSGSGAIAGSGTIALDAKTLALAFDLNQLDLAPLAKSGGLPVPLGGILSGKLEVSGPYANPNIAFKGNSNSISVHGFVFSNLAADVSGTGALLKVNSLTASLGGSPLSASGMIQTAPALKADLSLSGNGLDLAALTEGVPDLKGQIKGKADVKFALAGSEKGNRGSGSLSVPALELFGLKLSNVVLPLSLEGALFKSAGGTAALYGGAVTNSLSLDLASLKFTDTLKADGVDVHPLTQDAAGGFNGRISGLGNLSLNLKGGMGKALAYSGSGQFSMGAGALGKFAGMDVLKVLFGVDGLRYTKVSAALELQTGRLILKKGAQADAPEGDPIYRTARIVEDASITFDKKLYIPAEANMNFQLVNALKGGASGGLEGLLQAGAGLKNLAKSAASGALRGGENADFRDVSFKVTGSFDKPSVSLGKVGPSSLTPQAEQETTETAPATPQQKLQDAVKDKLLDAIAPKKPAETPPQPTQPTPETPKKKAEDVIKETILDAVRPQEPAPQPEVTPQEAPPIEEPEKSPEQQIKDQLKKKLGDELKKLF